MEKNEGGLMMARGVPIQGHVSDPAKCLGSKAANTVFKVGAGGDVDISGWVDITLYPTSDGQIEYNGVATQIEPIFAMQPNTILIHPNVTQIKINVACVVCGM